MADLSRLSLNTATLHAQLSLPQSIEACLRHGVRAIAPGRDKIAEYGLVNAMRHIRDAGLAVSGVYGAGIFTASDRIVAVEDTLRAIDEAALLGAACLGIEMGGLPAGARDLVAARDVVRQGLQRVLGHAQASGVKLALEPMHPMFCATGSVVTTLAQALDLVDLLGEGMGEGMGLVLDVFHVWWDPQLAGGIARAGSRILAVQVCDWANPAPGLSPERAMMGDGPIDLARILGWAAQAGYAGAIEVEVSASAEWWTQEPDAVMDVLKERFVACV